MPEGVLWLEKSRDITLVSLKATYCFAREIETMPHKEYFPLSSDFHGPILGATMSVQANNVDFSG